VLYLGYTNERNRLIMTYKPQILSPGDQAAFGEEKPVESAGTFDFDALLQREGGDKLHTDSGGLTKYGITSAWGLDEDQITNLSEEDALGMYKEKYDKWDTWAGEGGSRAVGDKMYDIAVNMGRKGSTKVLQNALNNLGYEVETDGGWSAGGQTDSNYQAAIADFGEKKVLDEIIRTQKQHYSDIIESDPEKYGDYKDGWQNRADFMGDYKMSTQ